jgi:hypothetical protein
MTYVVDRFLFHWPVLTLFWILYAVPYTDLSEQNGGKVQPCAVVGVCVCASSCLTLVPRCRRHDCVSARCGTWPRSTSHST